MKLSRIIALTLALLASLAASAQTITLTLGHKDCNYYHAARPNCADIPITASDGKSGSVWFDHNFTPYPNGTYGFVKFSGSMEYLKTAMVDDIKPDGSLQFSSWDSKGVAYHGILRYTHTTYLLHTGIGTEGHYWTYWRITGGTASIQRVDY